MLLNLSSKNNIIIYLQNVKNNNIISLLKQWKLCDDTHSECLTSVGAGNTNPVTLISSHLFVLGIAYTAKSEYNFSKNGTSSAD